MAETKKANMLDFTRSGLLNVSQSKSKFTTFLWSDNCSLFTDYTNLHLSLNMLQLIVSWYITWNALYATWCSEFFLNIGLNVGSAETFLHQNLVVLNRHGFLEFELFKTRSNNYWNLWKTNNFALLHQHVCNKYLATSSTRHSFASHWLVFLPMQPMSAPHCTTTRWQMLKFGGESSSVESRLTSTSSLSNSLMRKSLNSPSNILPSISFQKNVVHLVFGDEFTAL